MKRIKIVPDRPNRLFETWLEEWKNDAAYRNPDLRNHFVQALDSLKRYPLPLESGRDCIILQHFGTKLCSMLDKKLEEYKRQKSDEVFDTLVFETDSSEKCASEKMLMENNQVIEIQENDQIIDIQENDRVIEIQENDQVIEIQENDQVIEIHENDQVIDIKEDDQVIEIQKNDEVIEIQDKIVSHSKNAKKNGSKKLVNADKIPLNDNDRQIYFESNSFDIILLVDTQETCG